MDESTRAMQVLSIGILSAGAILSVISAGCGSPSAANIELRKKQQTMQAQIDQLTEQHVMDANALATCERSHPTTAALQPAQLEKLVTTHGLKIGELTGGNSEPGSQNVDTAMKIYVVPVDGDGVPIKASGSFTVKIFDLSDPAKTLIGTWNFDDAEVSRLFYSQFLLYTYILDCPWKVAPRDESLTVQVTFSDLLTSRVFSVQKQVKVRVADVRK